MTLQQLLTGLCLFLLLSSCQQEEVLKATKLLQGRGFDKGLKVDGHEFDSLIIQNCSFRNGALSLGDCDHVVIRNCRFYDIKNNGLKIGFTGSCSNIRVENCTFKNIGFNGIDSHEEAPNCFISGCTFKKCSQSQVGVAMAQPHHAIYWKGANVTISHNFFDGTEQTNGNAISVRSSGHISSNTIINSPKNGIMYYANHPGSDTLLIENNFISSSRFNGVLLTTADIPEYHNSNVIMRFNSIANNQGSAIRVGTAFETTTNVEVYGNLLMSPEQDYIRSDYTLNWVEKNYETADDPGFLNLDTGDLHISTNSPAIGFATGITSFPLYDIDNEMRDSSTLNTGADE